MPAHRPDVGIVHAQQADRHGNVQLWGIAGVQKEAVLASRARSSRSRRSSTSSCCSRAACAPGLGDRAVACVPGGAQPSYAHGYYERDNDFYVAWDEISRDRDTFTAWMRRATCLEGGSGMSTYTADEMMAVAAARRLTTASVCFVGIGLPSVAANLARRTHAPGCVLVYESGTIGAKPTQLPLSIGDGELAETADSVVSVPEMFATGCRADGSASVSSVRRRSIATGI